MTPKYTSIAVLNGVTPPLNCIQNTTCLNDKCTDQRYIFSPALEILDGDSTAYYTFMTQCN